jgi:abortive infection bacteriophage resistance protein
MANKVPYSIADQISLLKERGMIFNDKKSAHLFLENISYYRLKGYWWDMQSDYTLHAFKPDTIFEDIMDIYNFDRQLRLILFDAIERIEIALRSKMIYQLSMSYGGLWYLNSNLFEVSNTNVAIYQNTIQELNKEFSRSQEIFIKDQKQRHPNQDAITYVRNVIAHHSRLWNRNLVKTPISNLNNPHSVWLDKPLSPVQLKKPFLVISTMIYLCNQVAPNHQIKNNLFDLFSNYPNIPIYKLGFLNNWQNQELWKSHGSITA